MRPFLWLLTIPQALLLTVCASAQPLPTDPTLVTGQLDNGLRYVVRRHSNPPGRAAIWLHVHSGSLNETDAQRGLAHYLEHMAFNGSEHFPPGSVVPFFQSLGMTFGRDQNAFTSFEQTTYQLALPRAEAASVTQGLTFFADVLSRLSLLPAEIDAERQIIQEERIRSLSGQQRTMYYMLERIAPGSIFGQRIPIGTEETINSVQQADFQDYYGRWYVPSNATLMVVADADPHELVSLIDKAFAAAPTVPRPTPQDVGVKAYTQSFAIVASDPEVQTEQTAIIRLEPARAPTTTVEQLRDDLVAALGQLAFNRRLQDKVATGTTSYLSGRVTSGNESGVLYMAELQGRAQPGKWRSSLEELALELQRGRMYGFTEREIEDAKKQIVSSAQRDVETEPTSPASDLMRRMNEAVTNGEPIMSAAQYLELTQQLVSPITVEEVTRRFAAEFDPAVFSVTAILPASPEVPTESALLDIALQALAVQPEREVAAERPTQLMDTLPTPGEITEMTEHAATGVWSGWLSNNARLHYRFMDTRKNEVTVRISLLGGELHETAADRGVTQGATVAWSQPATARLSSADIRSLMTGKKVTVHGGAARLGSGRGGGFAAGCTDSISLTVSGSPEDLESGMQLAHLLLTEPKVEPAAFTQYVTMTRTMLQQVEKNPMLSGMRAVAGIPYPADVARTQPLSIAQLDCLKLEAAQTRLDQLIQTSPIEVAIVGDLPKERALALVSRYLGSLPARERVAPGLFADLRRLERPAGPRTVNLTIESETPQAFVYAGFYGPDQTNVADARAMSVASIILSTRMNEEIREKEQFVYSIGAGFRAGTSYPGFGTMSAAAPTDPAKTDRLLEKIHAMYAAMAQDGVSDEELSVAKRQIANTLDEQLREPEYWLGRLAQLTFEGMNLDDVAQAPAAYQAISADQVLSTFARYYSPATSLAVKLLPAGTN
ncbi:MAG: insulinase family protein [Planctomycetaceae bacterium]|nr:insulinase family protein [Planctomycetaceae bacterium]